MALTRRLSVPSSTFVIKTCRPLKPAGWTSGLPTRATVSLLDTPYNPIDLRLRGRAIVTEHQLSLGVFLNYINAYSDNIVTPSIHVPSWTTADASLSYEFSSSGPVLRGL